MYKRFPGRWIDRKSDTRWCIYYGLNRYGSKKLRFFLVLYVRQCINCQWPATADNVDDDEEFYDLEQIVARLESR